MSPTFSPDASWVAYYSANLLRLVRTNGEDDHVLLDLTPLGGRGCLWGSCGPDPSIRPSMISWTKAD
jgi:hypothetical protein